MLTDSHQTLSLFSDVSMIPYAILRRPTDVLTTTQMNTFCFSKGTIDRMKTQAPFCEKIKNSYPNI